MEGKNKNGGSYMTIEELKTSNPTLYKEIKEEGIKKERDRVLGHLTSGEKCGAIDYSHKCIRDGLTLNSQQVIAEYMTAGRNKQDVNDKEADNVDDLKTQDNTNEEEAVKKEVSKTVSFCEGLKKGA